MCLILFFILNCESFSQGKNPQWDSYSSKNQLNLAFAISFTDSRAYKENVLNIDSFILKLNKNFQENNFISSQAISNTSSPSLLNINININYLNYTESTIKNVFFRGILDLSINFSDSPSKGFNFTITDDILVQQSLKELNKTSISKIPLYETLLFEKLSRQILDNTVTQLLKLDPSILVQASQGHSSFVSAPVSEVRGAPRIVITEPDLPRGLKIVQKGNLISVKGRAIGQSQIHSVIINGNTANLENNGNFQGTVSLKDGETTIRIIATDSRSNEGMLNFSIKKEAEVISSIDQIPTVPVLSDIKADIKYYALIVGVQDYVDNGINDLEEPIKDATLLYSTLIKNYTFSPERVKLLKNPTRDQIYNELELLLNKVTENDNILIFYAGHGYWDDKLNQGYWMPSDSKRGLRSSYFSNSDLRDYIKSFKSKHTLLISDACFAGSILKTRAAFADANAAVNGLYELPSRKAMTSGAMKEVPDKSVFLEYLIKRLSQNNEKYLSAEQLFSSFRTAVINNSSNGQVPQFGEIREAGDEGGDFIFVKK